MSNEEQRSDAFNVMNKFINDTEDLIDGVKKELTNVDTDQLTVGEVTILEKRSGDLQLKYEEIGL